MSWSALFCLFGDQFYNGPFMHGSVLRQGCQKQTVTEDEFNRVQHLIASEHRTRRQKHEFAFTGMIRCGVCGCLITAERKIKHCWTTGRKAEYTYYHCIGRKGCRIQSVSEQYLSRPTIWLETGQTVPRIPLSGETGTLLGAC